MSAMNQAKVCVCAVVMFWATVAEAQNKSLTPEMIARAVAHQDAEVQRLDSEIDVRQTLLDRTKSGTIPKELSGQADYYKKLAMRDQPKPKVQPKSKTKAKAKPAPVNVDWRKVVRTQLTDLETQRDRIVNNETAALPSLNLGHDVGEVGRADRRLMITAETNATSFYGLVHVGPGDDDHETFVVKGWRQSTLDTEKVNLPRDFAKFPRKSSGGGAVSVQNLNSAIQGSLNTASGPEVREVKLSGVAAITSTTMVTNAWGTQINGKRECKVIEFICSDEELIQAVIAARSEAKKKEEKAR